MPLESSVLCPACLATNVIAELCVSCRAPLVLGGRFVARERLSQQRSARTLGGEDREDGSPVIIKTLGVSGMAEWKELELFERGIGVLRGLDHPGVPRHLGDGQFVRGGETFHFWVQQRVEGRSLAAGLEQGQRWTEARALAEGMLEILEYLQGFSPPIVHRDLKPSNILERPDGSWVLIDFDLVKDTLEPEGGATTALGTAGYAPLEQLMGRAVMASDLYGLGATLVAVLSRKDPADLLDTDAGRIEFREHVRISEPFAAFIERLLEPKVGRRPVDARAARALLHGEPTAQPVALAAAPVASEPPAILPAPEPLALLRAGPVELRPVAPTVSPDVHLGLPLVEEYSRPRWILPARALATAVAVGLMPPASGGVLAALLAVAWIVSGLVIRFPVELAPRRALYLGGITNTGEPGRHWARRRWTDAPYSIPLDVLRLRWVAGTTRLEHDGGEALWLELELEARVEPRGDDVGQFFALLRYKGWTSYPEKLAEQLRSNVLDKLVERVGQSAVLDQARRQAVSVDPTTDDLLATGLQKMGWTLVELERCRVVVGPSAPVEPVRGDVVRLERVPDE